MVHIRHNTASGYGDLIIILSGKQWDINNHYSDFTLKKMEEKLGEIVEETLSESRYSRLIVKSRKETKLNYLN